MRCNVGVNPIYLTDQFLMAEVMEIPMVLGSLKYWDWKIMSRIPDKFCLGPGHMNFLKTRLRYLERRHEAVRVEMSNRGFHNQKSVMHVPDSEGYFLKYYNDWVPDESDTMVIRERLLWKLKNKPKLWRYNRHKLNEEEFNKMLVNIEVGDLYYV